MSSKIIRPDSMRIEWGTEGSFRWAYDVRFAKINVELRFGDTDLCLTELAKLRVLLREDEFGNVEAYKLSKEACGKGSYYYPAIEDLVHKLYGNNLGDLACKIK